MEKNSPIFVFDFRCNESDYSIGGIKDILAKIAKKWVFQLEESDTGYKHYQGRYSLIKKRRTNECKKLIKDLGFDLFNYNEPSSTNDHKTTFYAMKEDTRIDGPWSDQDEVKFETIQIKHFLKLDLRPYQKEILNWGNEFEMRRIDLIYDKRGNLGKSIFSEYLEYIDMAEEVPPYRLMDDIFQWVCSRPKKKMYLIDMPRGMKKDKLGDLYAGIEVIKNGVCYDKRYTAKKIRFDRPRVVVFTNTLPNLELMSKDRWNLNIVNIKYELEPLTDEMIENNQHINNFF